MRNSKSDSRIGQSIYVLLKAAQRRFGLARIEIGALLCEIKDHSLWEGRAASFSAFLEEERINSSAAYSYMKVARKLFRELALSDRDFNKLSTVNMGTLELAADIIDHGNKAEIIDVLSVLGERDARQVLLEMIDAKIPPESQESPSPQVRSKQASKVLAAFKALPDDQRLEVLCAISPRSNGKAQA